MNIPIEDIPTPCYVVDTDLLRCNLQTLDVVQRRTGAKIILALKGFAMFSVFPIVREYLHGTAASSLNEARLGWKEFGKEVHIYAPAYKDEEFNTMVEIADHIVFNSFNQWDHFRGVVQRHPKDDVRYGIRINPEYSEVKVDLYNPCVPGSRFGEIRRRFEGRSLAGLTGLHFHTLCEQNADTLKRTLEVVASKFENILHEIEWINMGGGHHISSPDYDIDLLCETLERFREQYGLEIYLEPGEAIALDAGYLVTEVQDTLTSSGIEVAILDTSATAHMPDVLEMPYRPGIIGAGGAGEKPYTYRLGGLTCLAGDFVGSYSFDRPLTRGDRLVLTDMAIYTMVKNTCFNGIPLPSIATINSADGFELVRRFGYEDYRNRLS